MLQLSINSIEFSHLPFSYVMVVLIHIYHYHLHVYLATEAAVVYMISIPHLLMSVHCCEIDAYLYYYLIMTSQNAFYMISMVGTASRE